MRTPATVLTVSIAAGLGLSACVADISTPSSSSPAAATTVPATAPTCNARAPAFVGLHQLTNREYNDTVNDLFDIDVEFAATLPNDVNEGVVINRSGTGNMSSLTIDRLLAAKDFVVTAVSQPSAWSKLVPCDPVAVGFDACAQQVLTTLLPRAFRRPLDAGELDDAVAFMHSEGGGTDFAQGMSSIIGYVMLNPSFSYRVEADPDPTAASGTHRPLSSYELASRLSYFLWGTMPDAQLFSLAASATLTDPQVLTWQISRLLADPRAAAHLSSRFFTPWLQLGDLASVAPDPTLFPGFDDRLRGSMLQETLLLAADVVQGDAPISTLLDPGYTYVDGPLAALYGFSAVPSGSPMVKVMDDGSGHRSGVLTQASVLTLTSKATMTSAVRRGKYVLTNLLCQAPPPPPPQVNTNLAPTPADVTNGLTSRELLNAHVSNPVCAACHSLMDPIGFGLDNYDAIGAWRSTERVGTGSVPIDTSATLPTGETFHDAHGLQQILVGRDSFYSCLDATLLSAALDVEPDTTSCELAAITKQSRAGEDRVSAIVQALATSVSFTTHTKE